MKTLESDHKIHHICFLLSHILITIHIHLIIHFHKSERKRLVGCSAISQHCFNCCGYMASSDTWMKVNAKLGTVRQDITWPILRYYPIICLKGLRKILKNLKTTDLRFQLNVRYIITVTSKSMVKTTEIVKRLGFISIIPFQPYECV